MSFCLLPSPHTSPPFPPATKYTVVIWLITFLYRNHNWTLPFYLLQRKSCVSMHNLFQTDVFILQFPPLRFHLASSTSEFHQRPRWRQFAMTSWLLFFLFANEISYYCPWRQTIFSHTSNESARCYSACDHLTAWIFTELYTGC